MEVARVVRGARVEHVLPRVKHGGAEHVVGFGLALPDIHVPPDRRLLAQAHTRCGVVTALDQALVVEREALRNTRDRNAWRHDRHAEAPALLERRRSRRPPERLSSSASCTARRTGCRSASWITANPIRTRRVRSYDASAGSIGRG